LRADPRRQDPEVWRGSPDAGQGFDLDLMVPMVAGALLSIPFSTEFVKHTTEIRLKRMIAVFTILLGLFTIYKVLS